jgi:FkbM family methyltransferase
LHLTLRQRASWIAHLFKAATRQHHQPLRALFAPYIPADAVVVDIGAHAGQFSKLFARMAPRGRIHAFEPSPYARSIMIPALRWNRLTNVELHPLGLSDLPGQATLRTPLKASTALGFGTAHFDAGGAEGAGEAGRRLDQAVATTTLDAFAAERGLLRLDFIKADIEGWELRALMGGEATLRRFRPALYLEVDAACLARAGDTPEALFAWLAALGYRAFTTPDARPAAAWSGAGDYLFVAAEKADRGGPPAL